MLDEKSFEERIIIQAEEPAEPDGPRIELRSKKKLKYVQLEGFDVTEAELKLALELVKHNQSKSVFERGDLPFMT